MLLCGANAFVLATRIARADSGGGSGSQAGLVIEHGDGSVDTYCVGFSGDSITGDQLLAKVGIAVLQLNGAVCAVGNQEGCFQPHDFNSCFCDSFPPKNTYWSFFTAKHGQPWSYSAVSFLSAKAKDGDMQAWRWGVGGPNSAAPPPALSFEQVCTDRATQPATATVEQPTAAAPTTAVPASTSASAATSSAATPSPQPSAQASAQPSPPATVSSTLGVPPATASAALTAVVTIMNHGTATAVPQAPATGTTSASGSGITGLVTFLGVAALLGGATAFALVWRRRHGI